MRGFWLGVDRASRSEALSLLEKGPSRVATGLAALAVYPGNAMAIGLLATRSTMNGVLGRCPGADLVSLTMAGSSSLEAGS